MDHDEVVSRIRQILDSPVETHAMQINDLMRDSEKNLSQITSSICVKLNRINQHDFNDFFQMASIETFKQITLVLANPAMLNTIGSWWAFLNRKSANAIKSNLISNAGSMPASGMDNIAKRATAERRIHDKLRVLYGREPSEVEVVDEYNRNIVVVRKDPKKQGAIGKLGDMNITSPAESIDALPDTFTSSTMAPDSTNDSVLSSSEVAPLVKKIIWACRNENESYGKIAALWLGGFLVSDSAERMETKEIADYMQVSVSTVRTQLRSVRSIAIDVCGVDFGITENDI